MRDTGLNWSLAAVSREVPVAGGPARYEPLRKSHFRASLRSTTVPSGASTRLFTPKTPLFRSRICGVEDATTLVSNAAPPPVSKSHDDVTHLSPWQAVCYRFETDFRFRHSPGSRYGGAP